MDREAEKYQFSKKGIEGMIKIGPSKEEEYESKQIVAKSEKPGAVLFFLHSC